MLQNATKHQNERDIRLGQFLSGTITLHSLLRKKRPLRNGFLALRALGITNAEDLWVPQSTNVYLARICRKGFTRVASYSELLKRAAAVLSWTGCLGAGSRRSRPFLCFGFWCFLPSPPEVLDHRGNKSNLTPYPHLSSLP